MKHFLYLFLLFIVGCGNSLDSIVDDVPISENAPPIFALVVKDTTNPYMQRMFDGFQAACEEIGAEAVLSGPATPTVKGQIDAIQSLIMQDVSAIAIAANDADALEEVLKVAMNNDIKIISLDSAVNPDSRILHIQPADPEVVGRVLIQAAARMSRGSGQVAVLSTTPQASNQNLWITWMQQELNDNPENYSGIQLIEIVYGDDVNGKSKERTRYLLNTYPELDIIIAPTAVGMLSAGTVINELNSQVLLTGLALPSEMDAFIKNGICPWMYLWNPIEVGRLAAYTAMAIHNDEITGSAGQTFVAGGLGTKIIIEAHDGGTEVVLANPIKFDMDNISDWRSIY